MNLDELSERDRHNLYRNLVRECEQSRPERQELHRRLRTTYLNGRDASSPALYNRIGEYVDTSSAYLYDPEGARFVAEAATEFGDTYLEEEEAASDYFQKKWTRLYTLRAALAVEYGHVYPSSIAKVFANGRGVALRILDDPADFGVWREDLPSLDDQEAMTHHFVMDLPSLERRIASLAPEVRELIMRAAADHAVRITGGSTILAPTQNRIILAAVSPNAVGSASVQPVVSMAQANSNAPVVDLAELFVRDDRTNDWKVVTMFLPTETVLWEEPNPQPGIDPFYKLTLQPTTGYIWGLSIIERMIGLQIWRDERMGEIDRITKLNLDPPRAFLGVSGMNDEKAERLRSPGGHFTSANPGGKVENLAPPLPPDAWTLIDGIDRMFNRAGGLPPGADVGAEQPGVRAGDQLEAMADLGSPRIRKRAMYVEAFLNDVATAIFKVLALSKVTLQKPQTRKPFFLSDFCDLDPTVAVAAHSASPMYAERTFERAVLVYDRGAITDERLVQLSGLPMQSHLRPEARKIMSAKAENAKNMMEMKQAEAAAKVRKSTK